MSSVNARTSGGALPDTSRSTLWGDVTGALAHVSSNIRAAWYDTWKRVPGFPWAAASSTPVNRTDGRYGDPVGLGDVRNVPVQRAGPEPRALDQLAGNRENRAGMPDSARMVSWGVWAAAGALIVGAWAMGRR